MTGKDALKTCPFPHAVKRGVFLEVDTEDFGFVRGACSDCGATGPFVTLAGHTKATKSEKAEAARRWNTRSSGWQPISTAPKDGSEVLLYGQRGDQIDIGSWCRCGAYRPKTKARGAYFEEAWGHGGHKFWPEPRFWQPLPSSPSGEG